jgi:hypothetical protein
MSDYRHEVSHYKAKVIGQVDAKVVAPKGRKKKVDKPWRVVVVYHSFPAWGPVRHEFQHEHDARSFLRKEQGSKFKNVHMEYNGEKLK